MIPIDEKHMIRLAADGDMAAFEQLVTTHQPAIYRLALRMTGNPEDAADMTQEAFLRAWRGLGSFQADSSLSTWLFRLTRPAKWWLPQGPTPSGSHQTRALGPMWKKGYS